MRRACGIVQRASSGGHNAASSSGLHVLPRAAHRKVAHLSCPMGGVARSSATPLSTRQLQLRCLSGQAGEDKAERRSTSDGEEGSKETEKKDADAAPTEEGEKAAEPAAAEEAPEKTEAEKLQLEVDTLAQKLKSEKHNLLLALADFENDKKKFAAERKSRQHSAVKRFSQRVCEIFVEFEELQTSSEKASEDGALKNLQEGLDMTLHDFASTLEKFDIPRPEASKQSEQAE
mmetsp:Transcript_107/g.297  ORF Transcript_107/g.297 Transcript_107/m.297 type:complete len:232 (-) Transcript_107:80-775(-)